eukprot:SAG11_NODE_2498_length_3287_cov_1.417817_4_plen_89_part_01
MGACGSGPNIIVTTPPKEVAEGETPSRGTYQMVTGVYNLEKSLAVLDQAMGGKCPIPDDVLHRTRLRSDAIRKMGSSRREDLEEVRQA